MFEVGFSEVIVIAVVALIVIGPDKLPKLARTYGLLYGRVQRYVSGIKQDMEREVALDQMKKATAEAQQKLLAFQSQMISVGSEVEDVSDDKSPAIQTGLLASQQADVVFPEPEAVK